MANIPILVLKKKQKDGLKSEELKKLNESSRILLKMKPKLKETSYFSKRQ